MTVLEDSVHTLVEKYFNNPHVLGIHDAWKNGEICIIIQTDTHSNKTIIFPKEINGIPIIVEEASLAEAQSE